MSKRKGDGGLPPVPPKMRRGGRGRGGDRGRVFGDRRRSGPPAPHGYGHPPFAGSSSDEDVFLDPPMNENMASDRHRRPRDQFPFRPQPFPDSFNEFTVPFPPGPRPHFDTGYDPECDHPDFAPPPLHFDPRAPHDRFLHNPHQQPMRNDGGGFANRRPARHPERRHSLPTRGRDLNLGHGAPHDRRPSQGRDPSGGRSYQVDACDMSQSEESGAYTSRSWAGEESGTSFSDGSFPPLVSGDAEFDYAYRYGYVDRQQGVVRNSRTSSSASSGSDKSAHPQHRAGPTRGGVPGNRARGRGQGVRGRGGHAHQGPQPGQPIFKHQPLPLPKGNVNYMNHVHKNIHSLATVESNPGGMSLAEKLHRFMLFLRCEHAARVNDIQTIENAITGCHLDLKTSYETEDVGMYQGRHTFSGKLTLSGIFLARAVGQVKKELKHECYKLALQVLRSKTVTEILKQHDIGIDAIREKFQECSVETESSVGEAVVNLASAAPIAVAVETVATTEERWLDFINFLKGLGADVGNTISRIELSLSGSRCGLERLYVDVQIVDPIQGKPGFQGSLSVGGVLQGQGQGSKKKEAKQRAYDVAFERFTTLAVGEVLKGVPPQQVEEFKRDYGSFRSKVIVKEIRTPEHLGRFTTFIDRIKDSALREGPITLLDMTASQLHLLITCLYKKLEGSEPAAIHSCRLFVGDILISEGEGRYKKESQMDAYHKAYETLLSTPVDTIVSESHRLNSQELQDPDVHDVVVKGQMRKEESILPRLRASYPNLDDVLSKKGSEGLVIVEHQDWIHDRKRHAFCILQNSAIMNIMLMKWSTDVETGFFICKVVVQGEELGFARASSRQQARNLAAADALFKMYETHPVLRIINTADPSDHWITRVQLEERMKTMADADFAEADAEWKEYMNKRFMSKSDSEDGLAQLSPEQREDGKLDRRLREVAMRMVEEFKRQDDILADLVFAPDIPESVRRHLPNAVAGLGRLRSGQCQKDGKIFIVVSFRERVDKIVETMQARGVNRTSRFLLVTDRSELPCHADIEGDIETARTLSRQDRMAARTAQRTGSDRANRDAGVGISLNGSLFEADPVPEGEVTEMEEGFVTAQSSMLTSGNSPQGTPQTTPKQSPPEKKQDTPAEEVLRNFARAMMASGIAQTLIPMESSTPVSGNHGKHGNKGGNILTNPPQSASIRTRGAGPLIKNILISPPKVGDLNTSVTLSSPMTSLSLTGSAVNSAFPQPDFSSPAVRAVTSASPSSSRSGYGSNCSTISPNTSNVSRNTSSSSQHHHHHHQQHQQKHSGSGSVTQGKPPPAQKNSTVPPSHKSSRSPPLQGKGLGNGNRGQRSSVSPPNSGQNVKTLSSSSSLSSQGSSNILNTNARQSTGSHVNGHYDGSHRQQPSSKSQQLNQNQYQVQNQNQYTLQNQNQYTFPNQNQYTIPNQNQYTTPNQNQYTAPSQNQYQPPNQNQYLQSQDQNQYQPVLNQYLPNQNQPAIPNQYGYWPQFGLVGQDPGAPHTIQMSPATSFDSNANAYWVQNAFATTMFVENEVPVTMAQQGEWRVPPQDPPV